MSYATAINASITRPMPISHAMARRELPMYCNWNSKCRYGLSACSRTFCRNRPKSERLLRLERERRQAVEAENKLLRSLVQGTAA